MTKIEKILGNNPSKLDVINEFKKRNLTINIDEIVHNENEKFHVSGNISTISSSKEEALMKYAIILDEVL